jgi:hypothetical protein
MVMKHNDEPMEAAKFEIKSIKMFELILWLWNQNDQQNIMLRKQGQTFRNKTYEYLIWKHGKLKQQICLYVAC